MKKTPEQFLSDVKKDGEMSMKKIISVYELLGLIKDDKAPKKIMYNDNVYEFNDYDYRCIVTEIERGFVDYRLIKNYSQKLNFLLNEKVEILEEYKPIIEEIEIARNDITYDDGAIDNDGLVDNFIDVKDKLNEVIDYINRKEDK